MFLYIHFYNQKIFRNYYSNFFLFLFPFLFYYFSLEFFLKSIFLISLISEGILTLPYMRILIFYRGICLNLYCLVFELIYCFYCVFDLRMKNLLFLMKVFYFFPVIYKFHSLFHFVCMNYFLI